MKWSQEKKSLQILYRKIERTSHNLSKQDANDQSRNKGIFCCYRLGFHRNQLYSFQVPDVDMKREEEGIWKVGRKKKKRGKRSKQGNYFCWGGALAKVTPLEMLPLRPSTQAAKSFFSASLMLERGFWAFSAPFVYMIVSFLNFDFNKTWK